MKLIEIRGRFYSVWQTARIVRCTPQTIRNYIRNKTIKRPEKILIASGKYLYLIPASEVRSLSNKSR